jgi:hypothetical protein
MVFWALNGHRAMRLPVHNLVQIQRLSIVMYRDTGGDVNYWLPNHAFPAEVQGH